MIEKRLDDREQSYGGEGNGDKARWEARKGEEDGEVEKGCFISSFSFCFALQVLE